MRWVLPRVLHLVAKSQELLLVARALISGRDGSTGADSST
jgi:hypothetical protein